MKHLKPLTKVHIIRAYNKGKSAQDLALEYSVNVRTIYRILNKKEKNTSPLALSQKFKCIKCGASDPLDDVMKVDYLDEQFDTAHPIYLCGICREEQRLGIR